MYDFYNFANQSPWLVFFLAVVIASVLRAPFVLCNRLIRHLNIRKAGWPPLHLDADGDSQKDEKLEE